MEQVGRIANRMMTYVCGHSVADVLNGNCAGDACPQRKCIVCSREALQRMEITKANGHSVTWSVCDTCARNLAQGVYQMRDATRN